MIILIKTLSLTVRIKGLHHFHGYLLLPQQKHNNKQKAKAKLLA
jgi:hypothetical protein